MLTKLLTFISLIMLQKIPVCHAQKSSGLYSESDFHNQTTKIRDLTVSEKLEIARFLREFFELPEFFGRTKTRNKRTVEPVNGPKKNVGVEFLMDVHNQFYGDTRIIQKREVSEGLDEFRNVECHDVLQTISLAASNNGLYPLNSFWFDKNKIQEVKQFREIKELFLIIPGSTIQLLDVHEHEKIFVYGRSDFEKETSNFDLIAYKNVSNVGKWITINITRLAANWMENRGDKYGILLSLYPLSRSNPSMLKNKLPIINLQENSPFLLVKTNRPNRPIKTHVYKRQTRAVHQKKKKPHKSKAERAKILGSKLRENCQRKAFYINFADLNWEDNIIFPPGFNAYHCTGECNFPLSARMNPSAHAIVQMLAHLKNAKVVPKPCCAPQTLKPLTLLFSMEDSEVTLQRYRDMIIDSCGCM